MLRVLKRISHTFRVVAAILYFWLGGTFMSYVYLPLLRLGKRDPMEARRRCQKALQRGWLFFCDGLRFFRLVDVDPRRYTSRLPDGPCVIVANHPTLIDVVALLAFYEGAISVAKQSKFQGPLVGILLRYCGHVRGSDGSVASHQRVLDECVERLKEGERVVVFPEGTRSPPGELLPFRRGPFEIAARAGVPVVPVAITCDPPFLTKGMPWYRLEPRIARYELTELEPVPVAPGRQGAKRAMREVQQMLADRVDASHVSTALRAPQAHDLSLSESSP